MTNEGKPVMMGDGDDPTCLLEVIIMGRMRATLDDLMRVEDQAELIDGKIVNIMPMGYRPARVNGRLARSLHDHAVESGRGEMFTATLAYGVPELSSGRESFCPDVSYHDGPTPSNPWSYIPGPPTLAVEIRSEADYGPAAEIGMAAKRDDYFDAGTLVVWDVDCLSNVVRSFRRDERDNPATFHLGDVAHAEPALPGWRVAVDRNFS